jgi:hypothetical protein
MEKEFRFLLFLFGIVLVLIMIFIIYLFFGRSNWTGINCTLEEFGCHNLIIDKKSNSINLSLETGLNKSYIDSINISECGNFIFSPPEIIEANSTKNFTFKCSLLIIPDKEGYFSSFVSIQSTENNDSKLLLTTGYLEQRIKS